MPRARLLLLVLVAALLAGKWGGHPPALPADAGQLQGAWTITSVYKDGMPEPEQVGASMTFAGDRVRFQPRRAELTVIALDDKAIRRMAMS